MRRRTLVCAIVVGGVVAGNNGCGSSPPAAVVCDNGKLAAGCALGHCTLSSASHPLPDGAQVTLTETAVASDLQGDALSSTLCSVAFSQPIEAGDITLSIAMDQPPGDTVIFDWTNDLATAVPSTVQTSSVNALLPGSGTFGVTHTPGLPVVGGDVGVAPPSSDTVADTLRNLQSGTFSAAFFDGSHLIVGNGSRVLIYQGFPHLGDLPAVVLGQPDFDSTPTNNVSASSFGNTGSGSIWSDGSRLVVSNTNRVLIWLTFPAKNFAPADVVLGQPDFSSNKVNGGGTVSASTMFGAAEVDSDGVRLLVADAWNYRVLAWSHFPTTVGQVPDSVIGQPDLESNTPNGGATPLYIPYGANLAGGAAYVSGYGGPGLRVVDSVAQNNAPSSTVVFCWPWGSDAAPTCAEATRPGQIRQTPLGGVALRDWDIRRILVTNAPPSGPTLPAFVIGQPDALRMVTTTNGDSTGVNASRVDASSFGNGFNLGGRGDNLLVPDDRRLLIWSHFPTYDYEPADMVLGQAGFATNELTDYRNVTAGTLADPSDIALQGQLAAVADTSNNRVLLFHASSLTQAMPQAFAVLGQPDVHSFVANHDLNTVDATGLSGPRGVCLDGTHLVVADTENHRVLIWSSVPQQSGVPANIVLGQNDFSGHRPNHGNGDISPKDGFSDVDAKGLFYPTGVACDGTHLVVSDRANHRVLVWKQFPTTNGQAADAVLGQPSFTSVGAHGGAGPFVVTANGFNVPTGIVLDGTSLWVADTENNRVVEWSDVFGTPTPVAWLGQGNGTTVANANYRFAAGPFQGYAAAPTPATTSSSILRPRGVLVQGGAVYVTETDSNRLHVFDKQSLTPTAVIGQADASTGAPNAGGVSAHSLSEPMGLASDGTTLWLADGRNSRLLGYPLTGLSSGGAAAYVVGQSSLSGNGFNAATSAAGGTVSQPGGLRMTNAGELFATDPNNHRVLVFDTSVIPVALKGVIGQPDFNSNAANGGASVGATGLNSPHGVWADGGQVFVADTQNNRVLLFDRSASITTAAFVLGQSSMTTATPNGGGLSAASMSAPSDVCSDGTRLAVVDTGNSRVLVWNTLPTQDGEPADAVLGQSSVTGGLPNLGAGEAGINTLAVPSACVFAPEGLYVADTGNNRVLLYPQLTNGAYATEWLGQLASSDRVPATSIDDTGELAGPSGLAFDGVNLYVADRDLGRIVVIRDPKDGGIVRSVITDASGGYHASGGLAVVRTPFFTSKLFVSDVSSQRIFNVVSVSRLASAVQ
jgi:hypothetical protein